MSRHDEVEKRGRRSYHLSRAQRKYLETGDMSTYRPSDLHADVDEKVRRIPARLDVLFEDVELLHRVHHDPESFRERTVEDSQRTKPAEFPSKQSWSSMWLDLLGLDPAPDRDEVVDAVVNTTSETPFTEFGAQLGRLAGRLMLIPDVKDVNEDDVLADLAWGFLRGLCFDTEAAGENSGNTIQSRTEELTSAIESRAEAKAARTDELHASLDRVPAQLIARESGLREKIVATLDSLHIDSTDWLVDEVEWALLHRSDSAWGEILSTDSEQSLDEYVSQATVKAIVEEKNLVEKAQLMKLLDSDVGDIEEKSWRTVSGAEVLAILADEGPLSTPQINNRISSAKDHKSTLPRLAKDMAGIDCDWRDYRTWTDRPLLYRDGEQWDTTAYGDALKQHYADVSRDNAWIWRSRISEETMEEAIAELGIDTST